MTAQICGGRIVINSSALLVLLLWPRRPGAVRHRTEWKKDCAYSEVVDVKFKG
jgi:hypothetical protein